MSDMIDDNRFVLIKKYKQKLIEGTNISDSPEDMAAINSILFRFWQMGWLDKLEEEPHWIPVTEDTPDEERECWITPKTTSKVYRGIFTRHYGECHRTGFICDEGFMWLNTALAWMYCEVPEPYKGVTT